MPSLIGVTNLINSALQASAFSTQRFQGGNWNAIAEQVKETGDEVQKKRPVIVPDDGDCTDVSVDDTYPLVVYHRITGLEYTEPDDWNFGDPGMIKQETASMVLVMFGDRARLRVTAEDCVAAISANIPDTLTNAQLTPLQLLSATIEVGSANINKHEVFEQEYEGVEFNLKPNSIFISIPYKIISDYSPNCFELCN